MSPDLRGAALMTVSMAGFALEDLFLKAATRTLPLGQVMVIMGLSGMVVFAALARNARQPALPRALLSKVVLLRSMAELAGRLFYGLAIALIPLSTASAILQATPIVVVLGAVFLFGEKVGARNWMLILAGLGGVFLILRPGLEGFDALSLLAVAGMAGFAFRDLATRAAPVALGDNQLGVVGFAMLGLAGCGLLLWSGGARWPDAEAAAMVAGTTVFGLLGYGFLTRAMRTGTVAFVTPFRYTRLIFALVLGGVVLGERPDLPTLAGSAIIVACGIALLSGQRHKRR